MHELLTVIVGMLALFGLYAIFNFAVQIIALMIYSV